MSSEEKLSLLNASSVYKPFRYPWAYDAWLQQQRIHWLAEEVNLGDDVRDWKVMPDNEKNLLTQIFRFFTQADIDVNNAYMTQYMSVFKPTEVLMMLSGFSNQECGHIDAYSYLLDTIGMDEIEYSAFLKYKEMKDKHEHYQKFNMKSKEDIALTLAVFGAFTEGVQLFSSFAILLSFPRFGRMKGMGQIITWSARDESLHTASIIKLFQTFIDENREIWTPQLRAKIYKECFIMINHEDAFLDLAFEQGDIHGLTANEIKKYIRFIADRRLAELGLDPIFQEDADWSDEINYAVFDEPEAAMSADFVRDVKLNIGDPNLRHNGSSPLPWLDEMLNQVEHANFFEGRATEYSKAATTGTWDNAFSDFDSDFSEDEEDKQ